MGLLVRMVAVACLLAGLISPLTVFAERQTVRTYKLNSKSQPVRNRWVKNEDEPGCHDLRGNKEVWRFAQIGYAWCSVYSEGDCKPGSEIPALWGGRELNQDDIDLTQPQTRMIEGTEWYLHQDENREIGSWYCSDSK